MSLVGLITAAQLHLSDAATVDASMPYQLSSCESFSRRNYFPYVIKTLTDDKTPDGRNTVEVDANDKAIHFLFKLDFILFIEL